MAATGELRRTLGLREAVVVGVGSMVGAGVFAAWAPAAEAAGTGLIVGLAIAAAVAFCNATSSAQLAAVHPLAGGTYVYGRRQLGPAWGHLAGWGFVVGKTASCAAMALTAGSYLWPEQRRIAAVGIVVLITVVNIGGLTRTVAVTQALLAVSGLALVAVVVAGWSSSEADVGRLLPIDGGVDDILRSAGFLFFAFAGYARIATLGEEVREPAVIIPKAIPRALLGVLALYAIVGITALVAVPTDAIAGSSAPLRLVVDRSAISGLAPLVRIGAGVAALGVLLNLIPGVSRSVLAMARERDLPTWFGHVDVRRRLPLRAELTLAAVIIVLSGVLELRDAIGVSGVAVLSYYAVTNVAALTLRSDQRRWPRWLAVGGLLGCLALIAALPPSAIATGLAALAVGAATRWTLVRRRR